MQTTCQLPRHSTQKARPVPLARGTADAPGPHGSQTTMVQCKMKFVWVCVALAALVACRSQHMAAASAAEVSEDAGREIRSCRVDMQEPARASRVDLQTRK